jgi:glucokinase
MARSHNVQRQAGLGPGKRVCFSIFVRLLCPCSDFVGIGYGLLALTRKDVVPINDVPLASDAPKACIGAGTGLGEVYLTAGHLSTSTSSSSEDAEYLPWSSEGGHTDFAPRDAVEFGLMEFIKTTERVTRVSVERIVSGMGIPKIYEYFAHKFPLEINPEVTQRMMQENPSAIISEYAENGKCGLCRQSIELFIKCYGAEAGNMALKTLPFGGMYIAGGIAPKLLSWIKRNNLFYQHFVQKGRMQAVLEKVPLFIIINEHVGLLGAKVVCRRLLRRQGFLPGRGELAAFSEATPRASPAWGLGENFAYPDANESNQFETEVHLEPTTKKPEKVIVRRVQDSKSRRNLLTSPRAGAGGLEFDGSDGVVMSEKVRNHAFLYGILGGTVASVLSVAALTAANYFMTTRRAPSVYTGKQL